MPKDRISRRGALSLATKTIAGAAALRVLGPLAYSTTSAWAAEQTPPLSLGIESYSLREFPTDKMIAETRKLGLEHVEFFDKHLSDKDNSEKIDRVQQEMHDAGLRISSYFARALTKDHEANRKVFEFAKKCGMKNITGSPTPDAFNSLDKLVAEFDITVAIHNHGPKAPYDKITDTLSAIRGHDQRIGACADLGHYIRSGEDPVKAIHLFKGRLYGVHLKDFDAAKGNAKGVILGRGLLDVAAVFKALKAANFPGDGSLCIEYEENPKDPMADLVACVLAAQVGMKKAG